MQAYLKEEAKGDNYIDFVAVGSRGLGVADRGKANELGSFASSVVNAKLMNSILVTE